MISLAAYPALEATLKNPENSQNAFRRCGLYKKLCPSNVESLKTLPSTVFARERPSEALGRAPAEAHGQAPAAALGRAPAGVVVAEAASTAAAAGTVFASEAAAVPAEAAGGSGRQEEDSDRVGERELVSMMPDRCRQVEMSPPHFVMDTPNITPENSVSVRSDNIATGIDQSGSCITRPKTELTNHRRASC